LFVAREKREAIDAVVAFAHLLQSAASGGEEMLQRVHERIAAIYAGKLELPRAEFRDESQHVVAAMSNTIGSIEIPVNYFHEMADGFSSYVGRQRYATWASLEKDLRAIAGRLALALAAILGVQSSDAGEQLTTLAVAIALIEILRHRKTHLAQGRINLPLEDLVKFKCSEADLAEDHCTELLKFERERAKELLNRGAAGICWLADYRARLFASTIAVNYARVLREMDERKDLRGIWMWGGVGRALRTARRRCDEPLEEDW
jgi:phytoene synthase